MNLKVGCSGKKNYSTFFLVVLLFVFEMCLLALLIKMQVYNVSVAEQFEEE